MTVLLLHNSFWALCRLHSPALKELADEEKKTNEQVISQSAQDSI